MAGVDSPKTPSLTTSDAIFKTFPARRIRAQRARTARLECNRANKSNDCAIGQLLPLYLHLVARYKQIHNGMDPVEDEAKAIRISELADAVMRFKLSWAAEKKKLVLRWGLTATWRGAERGSLVHWLGGGEDMDCTPYMSLNMAWAEQSRLNGPAQPPYVTTVWTGQH